MLCVLKTTVSMIWFFWAPKTCVQTDKNNRNFMLKILLNWPNLRALSCDSLLILTHKLHCTSKGDALKWPALKKKHDSSNSIVWTLNNGWIFFWDHCFLKICLSGIQVGYQTLWIQIMPNILTWTCLRLLTKFISEIARAGKHLMFFKFNVFP